MFKISEILTGNWMNSKFIANNIRFILFIIILSLFYIANKYNAENIVVKSGVIKHEIIELRSEYAFYTNELMRVSTEIELENRLIKEGSELRIQKMPAIIIKRSEKE